MSHTPHELIEEFPDKVEAMQSLKQSDAHFAKLYDEYHTINRAIHRAETDIEPTDDLHMSEMRKQRMVLNFDEKATAKDAFIAKQLPKYIDQTLAPLKFQQTDQLKAIVTLKGREIKDRLAFAKYFLQNI